LKNDFVRLYRIANSANLLLLWQFDGNHVALKTEGRPLYSNIELWCGPDYTPSSLKVYIEDGLLRPLNAMIATPLAGNAIAIYNTATFEYPFDACVEGDVTKTDLMAAAKRLSDTGNPITIQGGALKTFDLPPSVNSVQLLLETDGRNLKGKIELLQGPNNIKQVLDYYTSDGKKRTFYVVIESPGGGNVVRIVNENTVEYPFTVSIAPYAVEPGSNDSIVLSSRG